ncbi:hypothetical protein ACTFR8_23005 [Bacillus cereus group sp. MYBK15-3]|uniref:hypothetical protein n=1 Tax=unclassified Bacillus cereus group TaxID=2750818 RepID=UPI003F79DEBD
MGISFDAKTGLIDKITYQVKLHQNRSVFRSDTVISETLTKDVPITEPTVVPFQDYIYAPDLESLLVE